MPYQGDIAEDTTLDFEFTSRQFSTGAPFTLAGTPSLAIYKSNGDTESTAGITLTPDFDSVTGLNHVNIDTSADAFYAIANDYQVVIAAGSVDSVSVVGEVVGSFSIENRFAEVTIVDGTLTSDTYDETSAFPVTVADTGATSIAREGEDGSTHTLKTLSSQIGGISTGSAAQSIDATSYTLTTGTQTTGTFANASNVDGVYHGNTAAAGTLDYYYTMNIGTTSSPVEVSINGRLDEGSPPSGDDLVDIIAYNNDTTAFEVVKGDAFLGVNGSTGANDTTETATLFARHADASGDVKIGIQGTSLEANTEMLIDQAIVSFTSVGSTVGYANGSVWVDTVDGTAGAIADVNGVADNPCLTWADALTVSGLKSLKKFEIAQGSEITLAATTNNKELTGLDYQLHLGGQQVDNTTIIGAVIDGTATGNGGSLLLERCKVLNCTLPEVAIVGSAIAGTVTSGEIGTYFLDRCASAVAGTAAPTFDFGIGLATQALNVRHYSGGLEIQHMGETATDTMSIEGDGQLILNANCDGGTIAIRGNFTVTDNASGAVTLSDEARFDVTQITGGAYPLNTTATGNVGIDWANVENPTSAGVTLTGTTVDLITDAVDTSAIATGAFTADAFAADALVAGTFATNAFTSDALASSWVTEIQSGLSVPGDDMNLADNAITASKYDESTAYPVVSMDSGTTRIARTGADGDTLETLSIQVDAVPTVAEFEARTILAAAYFDPAADEVALVTTTTNVTNGVTLTVAERNSSADALLVRSITNTQDTAGEHTLTTVVLAILESSVAGTVWTIKKTGGTTFATKTLTVDAAANPITGVT